MNSRETAFSILQRIDREELFAHPLLERVEGDVRDRNFVRSMVLGVLRWRLQLDYLIAHLASRAIGRIDEKVAQILRIGIYQQMHMNVPAHAAVSESVELARRMTPRAKSFTNAILRAAARVNLQSLIPAGEDSESLSIRFSHPLWMVNSWRSVYGDQRTRAILAANQELSFGDLIVNTTRCSVSDASQELCRLSIDHEVSTLVPGVIRLKASSSAVHGLVERGLAYGMDEGSAAIPMLLPSEIDGNVIDMAAAPGGKTFMLTMQGHSVVSNDLSISRLTHLVASHERLFDAKPRAVASDGRHPPFRAVPAVLLDAPCSATGTIRKNPEVKWRLKPQDIETFVQLQTELLRAALDLSTQYCIYSTCSLQQEENEGVVASVLRDRHDFEILDPTPSLPEELARWIDGRVLHLTPESGTDGFVAHLLRRTSTPK